MRKKSGVILGLVTLSVINSKSEICMYFCDSAISYSGSVECHYVYHLKTLNSSEHFVTFTPRSSISKACTRLKLVTFISTTIFAAYADPANLACYSIHVYTYAYISVFI